MFTTSIANTPGTLQVLLQDLADDDWNIVAVMHDGEKFVVVSHKSKADLEVETKNVGRA